LRFAQCSGLDIPDKATVQEKRELVYEWMSENEEECAQAFLDHDIYYSSTEKQVLEEFLRHRRQITPSSAAAPEGNGSKKRRQESSLEGGRKKQPKKSHKNNSAGGSSSQKAPISSGKSVGKKGRFSEMLIGRKEM
jgi:hypothetical protein